VAAGMGIALLPTSLIATTPARASLSLLPLKGDNGKSRTLLIWRKGTLPARIEALATCLTAESAVNRDAARP